MKPPKHIPLPDSVTEYATGCLAMGENRIWVDQHIEEGGILELDWRGKLIRTLPKPHPPGARLTGLRLVGQRLHWTCGTVYVGERDEPTNGWLDLETGDVSGPFAIPGVQAALRRGCTFWTPHGTGHGGGGYYNRAGDFGASWGPACVLGGKIVLYYPEEHRCRRPKNVKVPGDWIGTDPGKWTGGDVIGGDLGAAGVVWQSSKQRLTFFAKLAVGKVEYVPGGIFVDRYRNYLYQYDTATLLDGREPWRHVPKIKLSPYGDVRGVAQYDRRVFAFVSGRRPFVREVLAD